MEENGKHPKIKINYENQRGRSGEKKHVHFFFGLASFCNPPQQVTIGGGRGGGGVGVILKKFHKFHQI
jgi:hypothetical protein